MSSLNRLKSLSITRKSLRSIDLNVKEGFLLTVIVLLNQAGWLQADLHVMIGLSYMSC